VPSKNQDWLALTVEEPLEPDLPICDPHHHLWDMRATRVSERYLLDEVLEDVVGGHNVVSTVFIECGAMYRADGPEAMGPVGEIEFVNGIAAMSASGLYGPARVAAGIVGTADLRVFWHSRGSSHGRCRPGRGGQRPPRVSSERAIRAWAERNPNARRAISRTLVLSDSTRPLLTPCSSVASMSAR
jgi:hypothetical protein